MINRNEIQAKVNEYIKECKEQHKRPTYDSLATKLDVTGVTISNIVKGKYKTNRCIASEGFEIIKNVFKCEELYTMTSITTTRLKQEIKAYKEECERKHKKPSYNGLAKRLHISGNTIRNIVNNNYEGGKPYTNRPGYARCIANKDFKLIRNLYKPNGIKHII